MRSNFDFIRWILIILSLLFGKNKQKDVYRLFNWFLVKLFFFKNVNFWKFRKFWKFCIIDFKYIIQCHFFTLVGLELIKNDVQRVFCDFRKIDFRANFGRILKKKLKKWTD